MLDKNLVFIAALLIPYFVIPGYYKYILFFSFLISIFYIKKYYLLENRDLIFLFISILIFPVIGDFINVLNGNSSASSLEKNLRNLLLLLPMISLVVRVKNPERIFLIVIPVILISALICQVLQINGFDYLKSNHFNGARAGLWWNPIPFSNAALFLYAAYLACLAYVFDHEGCFDYKNITISVITTVVLFMVIYLSGTRGSVLAMFVSIVVFFVILLRNKPLSILKSMFFLVAPLFFLPLVFFLFQEGIQKAAFEVYDHFKNGASLTSVSVRLTAWGISLQAFISSPWLGIGTENMLNFKNSLLENGDMPSYMMGYHAHSDMFDALERGGVVGILGVVFLYLSPFFLRSYFRLKYNIDMIYVFILSASVFSAGLTDVPLRNNISSAAFYISVSIVLIVVFSRVNNRFGSI